MGWSVGYDETWHRDIGYGVPAMCDHPGCTERIDRGLAYVCAGSVPYGGDGCGLYFCPQHQNWRGFCERCQRGLEPFEPTPDLPEWMRWKLTDESWAQWRNEHPDEVAALIRADRAEQNADRLRPRLAAAVAALQEIAHAHHRDARWLRLTAASALADYNASLKAHADQPDA